MKLKKIIAILLSLSLVLSIAPVGFAIDSDDSELGNRMMFLSSIPIQGVDSLFQSPTVSRANFVSMVVSMMNLNLSQFKYKDEYIDVLPDSKYAPAIAAALSYDLISVDFNRRFNPDRAVTVDEAAKLLVCALGYKSYADVTGGYPIGYIKLANSMKIMPSVNTNGSDTLTPANAVDMVYSALHAPLMISSGIENGEIVFDTNSEHNLLTDNYKLKSVVGTVLSAGMYSMSGDNSYTKGYININGTSYKCDFADVHYYFAKKVTAWVDSSSVIRVLDINYGNKITEIQAEDIHDFTNTSVSAYINDKVKKYNLDTGFSLVENGVLTSVIPANYNFANGTVTLIDNNGDGKYDVINVKKIKYLVVDRITDDGRIYDVNHESYAKGTYITATDDDDNGYILKIPTTGDIYTYSDISALEEGMVLSVCEKSDGSFVEIIVSTKIIEGTADGFGEDSITIDGTEYKKNDYFTKYYGTMSIGTSGMFALAHDNTLTYVGSPEGANMVYGFLMGVSKTTGLSGTVKVKILTVANEKKIFALSSKVILDGKKVDSNSAEMNNVLKNGEYPKYGLIKYGVNDEGKIDKIDTPEKAFAQNDTLENTFKSSLDDKNSLRQYMDKNQFWYKYYQSTAVGNFNFGNTVVFRAPNGIPTNPNRIFEDDFFVVSNTDYLIDDDKCLADSFDYNEDFQPGAVVLYDVEGGAQGSVAEATPGQWAIAYMVDSVTEAVYDDGEITTKLVLNDGTKYYTKYIEPELNQKFKTENRLPTPGDVIRTSETAGVINGLLIDVDYNPDAVDKIKINYTNSGLEASLATNVTYVEGKAYSSSKDMFSLIGVNIPMPSILDAPYKDLLVFKSADAAAVMYDTKEKEVKPIYVRDIHGALNYGSDAAYDVVVKCSSGTFSIAFVYSK